MTPARPSLKTAFGLVMRLKAARCLLWAARATGNYQGAHMRLARRLVEAAERALRGRSG